MIDGLTVDRRTFLRRGAMGAGSLWALSLGEFMSRSVKAAQIPSPYGAIGPVADETTGLELLQLPDGFRYMFVQLDRRSSSGRNALSQPARRDGGCGLPAGASKQAHSGPQSRGGRLTSPVHRPAGNHLCRRWRRRHDKPRVQYEARALGRSLGQPGRHRSELRGRRDAMGHLDHRRGNARTRDTAGSSRSARRLAIRRRSRRWAGSPTKPA